MRRVMIDGRYISRVLPSGRELSVDTREYIALQDDGNVYLESAHGLSLFLGHRSTLHNGLVTDYYSSDKLALINSGIREILG